MSPADRARLERSRFVALSAARASGAVVMMLGLWIWLGDALRQGGWPAVGGTMFVIGFVEALILPQILIRRWRTPPPR